MFVRFAGRESPQRAGRGDRPSSGSRSRNHRNHVTSFGEPDGIVGRIPHERGTAMTVMTHNRPGENRKVAQAGENRKYVRDLLKARHPEFSAALETVVRDLSGDLSPGRWCEHRGSRARSRTRACSVQIAFDELAKKRLPVVLFSIVIRPNRKPGRPSADVDGRPGARAQTYRFECSCWCSSSMTHSPMTASRQAAAASVSATRASLPMMSPFPRCGTPRCGTVPNEKARAHPVSSHHIIPVIPRCHRCEPVG